MLSNGLTLRKKKEKNTRFMLLVLLLKTLTVHMIMWTGKCRVTMAFVSKTVIDVLFSMVTYLLLIINLQKMEIEKEDRKQGGSLIC